MADESLFLAIWRRLHNRVAFCIRSADGSGFIQLIVDIVGRTDTSHSFHIAASPTFGELISRAGYILNAAALPGASG